MGQSESPALPAEAPAVPAGKPQPVPLLLKKPAAAKYLGVSPRKLDGWVAEGRIARFKLSERHVVFKREEVERFAEELTSFHDKAA